MKLKKGIAIPFVVLLIVVSFLPAVSSEMDSLAVIMTAEDKIYETGDTIQIEVHVFDKGVLTDGDFVNVTLDTSWQSTDLIVNMSRISTGLYRGSYQITEDDNYARFSANVMKGNDTDSASLNINIAHDELVLDIHFNHQTSAYAWPGESRTATLTLQYGGDFVDADDFTYIRFISPSDDITDLTSTRVSEGVYEVTCTIPNATENGNYELEARATYVGAHDTANSFITVNVLSVWYNLNSVAGNTATFTLGVADEQGNGVADANITITHPSHLTGTTNEIGTAIFSLTNVWNGVSVRGYVTSNDMEQSFEGNIYTSDFSETPDPAHHNFDVIYEGAEYIYSAGSNVVRSYKAYNSTIPLQSQNIYYYITLEAMDIGVVNGEMMPVDTGRHIDGSIEVIDSGLVTTSQLGAFSLSFTAPSDQGQAIIHFEAGMPKHAHNYNPFTPDYDTNDELVYEEDIDGMFISNSNLWNADNVAIESDPLVVGGKTKVTITTTEALNDGDELFAKWMSGIPSTEMYDDDLESEWVCWVEGGNRIFLEEHNNDNEFVGYAIIPDFMSEDGNYTIVAGLIDGTTGYPNINHVSLKPGESAGDTGTDTDLLLGLIAAFVLVIIIIALVVFARGGKGKTVSPPQRYEDIEPLHKPEDKGKGFDDPPEPPEDDK